MSDDMTKARKERHEKLELLQELYFILHRNCLESVDELLKMAIGSKFRGKLELRIVHGDQARTPRRRQLDIALRLCTADEAERADAVYYPVDHYTLVDMYERLKARDENVADGPQENVTVFDVSKGSREGE